jgi:hypothetical protein
LYVIEEIGSKFGKWHGNTLMIMSVDVKLTEFAMPASPIMSFLSNPVGSVMSSIGMPGPMTGSVSQLGTGAQNLLAAAKKSL